MLNFLKIIALYFMIGPAYGQEVLNLYPQGALNAKATAVLETNSTEFYLYKPLSQVSKKVFLILPGGGYSGVAMRHEGHDVAKRLRDAGYASFLLRYRLPVDSQMVDKKIGPIQDAQSAIVYMRRHAQSLGVELADVVVLGFSAGGHLASTLSTHFDTSYIGDVNMPLLRPDYSILVYPVITMKRDITHFGSKNNLIGPDFKEEDVKGFSNELHVNERTPPTFIVHADEDKVVPIENALLYKEQLDNFKVKNKFYRYQKGTHGFGMYNKEEEGDWFEEMLNWLNTQ